MVMYYGEWATFLAGWCGGRRAGAGTCILRWDRNRYRYKCIFSRREYGETYPLEVRPATEEEVARAVLEVVANAAGLD